MGGYGDSQVNSGLNVSQTVTSLGIKYSKNPIFVRALGSASYAAVNKEITETMKQSTINLYEQEYGSGSWNELSAEQKEQYYQAYSDGRLKRAMELGKQLDNFHKELPSIKNPAVASQKLIQLIASAIPEFQNAKTADEKQRFCENAILNLIGQQSGIDVTSLTETDKKLAIERFGTLLQAAFFAEQNGKISSLLDIKNFTKEEIQNLEYEYASYVQNNYEGTYNKNLTLRIAKERGDLERAIVANSSEVKSIEELHKSNLRYKLELDYLKGKPADKLSAYEIAELKTLSEVAQKYNGDLTNVKINSDHSTCVSYASLIYEGKDIDWNADTTIIALKNQILSDLKLCKTEEERKELLETILHTNSLAEDVAVMKALALVEHAGLISFEEIKTAQQNSDHSSHTVFLASPQMSAQAQLSCAHYAVECATGENADLTGTQTAGVMENVCTEYDPSVQSEAVNTIADTGIPEVKEAVADTMEKMDTEAAKETFDHVMQSNVYTETEKQEIARDSIDKLDDNKNLTDKQKAELKNYYTKTAEKHNIDYTKALPREERPNYTAKKAEATTSNKSIEELKNQKIEGTNITIGEFQAFLEKAVKENTLDTFIENPLDTLNATASGIKETLLIIGGNTLDLINKTSIRQISSVSTAMKAVGKGVKLDVVFKNCSDSVQRILVQNICLYYPQALPVLIDKFNGEMILELAQTPQAKQRVLDEWADVALNNATERNNLSKTLTSDKNLARDFMRESRFESLG